MQKNTDSNKLSVKFLFCVVASTAFSDDIYLDLTGIFKFILDLLNDVSCNKNHLIV